MRNRQKTDLHPEDAGLYSRHSYDRYDVSLCPIGVSIFYGLERQRLYERQDDEMHADEASQVNDKYRTIVFDLGNTVIRFDHAISARKIATLFNIDSKKIYDTFFDSEITRAFDRGRISPRQFHAEASKALGVRLPYKDFTKIWSDIFWEDEDAAALVRELKSSGYRLFLLSNINRLHFEYIEEKFDIIKAFDELILSYMIGAIKPEPAIYEDVIKRAGGDKSKILYIDDREDLVKEALRLGIDSIRFEGAENLKVAMKKRGVL